MKNTVLIFLFFFSVSHLSIAQECVNEVELEELNLKFCLEEGMGVHQLNDTEATVVGYDSVRREDEWVIRIKAKYNTDDNTPKELWNTTFEETTHLGGALRRAQDSTFKVGEWDAYMNFEVVDLGSNKISSASAILTYHHQFYALIEISFEDTLSPLEHMIRVINSIDFSGEPVLSDDAPMKNDFKFRFEETIKQPEKLEELIVSMDFLLDNLEGKDREDLVRDSSELNKLFKKWHNENENVFAELNQCEQFELVNIQYRLDKNDGDLKGYTASISLICDGESKLYRVVLMALKGKMYLAAIKEWKA